MFDFFRIKKIPGGSQNKNFGKKSKILEGNQNINFGRKIKILERNQKFWKETKNLRMKFDTSGPS